MPIDEKLGKAIQMNYKVSWASIPEKYKYFTFDCEGFYFWTEKPTQVVSDLGVKYVPNKDASESFEVIGTRPRFSSFIMVRQDA